MLLVTANRQKLSKSLPWNFDQSDFSVTSAVIINTAGKLISSATPVWSNHAQLSSEFCTTSDHFKVANIQEHVLLPYGLTMLN